MPQARAGDAGAWDQLFRRYQLPIFAYVREWVHDEQASLDIVQETFISAVRHLAGLRDDERFGAWLFGIAHQKCLQHWRRVRPFEPLDTEVGGDLPGTADDGPADGLLRREQAQQLFALLDRLPAAHRAVLLLHFIEDFPLAEIATITGVPLGTVKSRMHHAKHALRQLWKESEP